VIKDIDAFQRKRPVAQKGYGNDAQAAAPADEDEGITLSGLLNTIDGMLVPEGQILMMTTNHPENLDAALLRPGRTDKHIRLGTLDANMIADMFGRFYDGAQLPEGALLPALTGAQAQQLFTESPTARRAVSALSAYEETDA